MDDMDIKKRYLYHEKYYLGSTSRIPQFKTERLPERNHIQKYK